MSKHRIRSNLKKAGKETGVYIKKAAWSTCKLACWIACCPCLFGAIFCVPRRRRRTCVMHGPFVEPVRPQFPAPRRRALSLPLMEAQDDQKTLGQPYSKFMTKLPLEIRRMVYAEALGGASIHFMTVEGEPYARACQKKECDCGYFDPTREKGLEFGLALLRTCRQIYSEAVEYLYTSNTFSLSTDRDEFPTMDYLSYYILPQRLSLIRDLRIHWELDSIPYYLMTDIPGTLLSPWTASWEALERLKGLRRLHIDLVFRYSHWSDYYEVLWKDKGDKLLEVVKNIRAPREFVIVLPDRRCSLDVDVGQSRCVLKLPGEGTQTLDYTDP